MKTMKQYLNDMEIVDNDLLCGLILGNGSVEMNKDKETARLKFTQSTKYKDYIEHLFSMFCKSGYISQQREREKMTVRLRKRNSQSTKLGPIYIYEFETMFIQDFTFWDIFYNYVDTHRTTKRIPVYVNWFEQNFSAKSLAYLYMDKGSIKSHSSLGVLLNLQILGLDEVKYFINFLNKKFGLICKPRKQKQGYQIYISGHSHTLLKSLISPYLNRYSFFNSPSKFPQKKLQNRNKK